ncbi:DegT/DnrJ/EryC1/StrS family aminotransferase [Tunicatimonas pelagia]|uniref:DegT/DnrJ/EryC1/StrS family aminotransferase n=1 Tax=Tunicatimonas pelagia TaxID=931531 RepID=UPI0026658B05|nr:DegT/DnrJ/EryC1/StrS family aminotransferase [Tunicatimonas pelagia]WKN44207.1 DegT/DnrJ/EryC1/StrS family aminotransferase [Tunicatimonas pelagia]
MIATSTLTNPSEINAPELFAVLPPNRCGSADRAYMDEVLDDGFGNKESANMLARFEQAFAEKFGAQYAISMNSGSGTLVAALMAAGVGPGDEVLVPSLTMAATAFSVIHTGAVPVFVDSDPRTYCLDPTDAWRKTTEFTKAIMPVSIYGLSPDFDPIMDLAQERSLAVIEDDAQTFLGTYRGKMVGTIGHAGSFSFQGSKHMTTGGDGGIVITDDEEYAIRIRKAAVQGYRTLGAKPGSTMIPRDERQDWRFERHDSLGYNFRMSAPQAALGLGQLERLNQLVDARRYVAHQYDQVIAEEKCEWLRPPHTPDECEHTYWCYPAWLNEAELGVTWRDFRKKFIELGGDGLYGCYTPVHLEPVFRELSFYGDKNRSPLYDPRYQGKVKSYQAGDCPVLEEFRKGLCLFKTGMQTLDKVRGQVDALQKVIRYYQG